METYASSADRGSSQFEKLSNRLVPRIRTIAATAWGNVQLEFTPIFRRRGT